jgi:hypothetical protein
VVAYNHNIINYKWYKLYSNNFGTPILQNVINAAIFIGINLKPNIIELYGVDHTWLKFISVNKENRVEILHKYFYGKAYYTYCNKGGSNVPYKYHELLYDYAKMFETYHILDNYSNQMGVKILNKSEESYIDAFHKQ